MFEKEAQSYAFDEVNHKQQWYIKHPEHSIDWDYEDIKKHWEKGAEFGYNKANEWHYIKDGNLPKENENVLIYSNRANHIGFYRNGFWFTNSDGCLEDDDIEVIAWKEIGVPKEVKE